MDKAEIIRALNTAYFSPTPHEQQVLRLLPRLLVGTRVFADIGASLGQFTKCANECLKGGRLVAVEADPLRFEELARNCREWSRGNSNHIESIHAAATEAPGKVTFQATDCSVSGGLFRHNLDHLDEPSRRQVQWREVIVDGLTLDSLFPDGPPDFVKMDIEGAELLALRGAAKIVAARRTLWLIELHDFAKVEGQRVPEAVRELFRQHGYGEIILHGKSLFYTGSGSRFGGIWLTALARKPWHWSKRRLKILLGNV